MKKWVDPEIYNITELHRYWLSFSTFGSIVAFFLFSSCLFLPERNVPFVIKILLVFFLFILILWLRHTTTIFLNGKSILREISIENNKLIFEDALHVKKVISNNEILKIDYDEKNWILFKSKISVMLEGGFNIILKNGEFYRVSPNTENIDELKEIILNKMQAVS